MHVDLLLRGGQLCDGSGTEPVAADVAISDGRVVAIGDGGQWSAAEVVDTTGRW